jgi:phytoene synthase
MQLTNIARDVGEDARAGRLYLPLQWLDEMGIAPDAFLANPAADPRIRALTARLLSNASALYSRAEAGIPALPLACRPGIFAARHVYAGIGGAVARGGYDSITRRARTTARQKIGWLGLSIARSAASMALPVSATLHAPPAPEVAFLVDAAARISHRQARSEALLSVFAQLEAKDRAQRVLERARG